MNVPVSGTLEITLLLGATAVKRVNCHAGGTLGTKAEPQHNRRQATGLRFVVRERVAKAGPASFVSARRARGPSRRRRVRARPCHKAPSAPMSTEVGRLRKNRPDRPVIGRLAGSTSDGRCPSVRPCARTAAPHAGRIAAPAPIAGNRDRRRWPYGWDTAHPAACARQPRAGRRTEAASPSTGALAW